MFDLRYHVASLAAVFLALIIGILVGVGISSGGFVSKSERSLLNARIADLQQQLNAARQTERQLSQAQRAAQTFVADSYPALMAGRLRGRRVALVFVGPINGLVRSLVERTLSDAGAPSPLRIRALKVPIDLKAVDAVLAGRPALAGYAGDARAGDLGALLGRELAGGGETPLWNALSAQLVEERFGSEKRPADAVVVVRSAQPQSGATARLLAGFYAGLGTTQSPAVGAETTGTAQSAVVAFAKNRLSTVDDLDTPAGRLALALLLAGAKPGQYGVKATAKDGLLPPVEPVPRPTSTGG